jgi:hypothetical protein
VLGRVRTKFTRTRVRQLSPGRSSASSRHRLRSTTKVRRLIHSHAARGQFTGLHHRQGERNRRTGWPGRMRLGAARATDHRKIGFRRSLEAGHPPRSANRDRWGCDYRRHPAERRVALQCPLDRGPMVRTRSVRGRYRLPPEYATRRATLCVQPEMSGLSTRKEKARRRVKEGRLSG